MSSFKLYEVSELLENAIVEAEQFIDEETGELPEDWELFLNDIEIERDDKILSIARYLKNINAESEAIKNEEKKLKHRRSILDNKHNRIKNYLQMFVNNGEKISDQCVAISWRKSNATIIDDESNIPDEYFKVEKKVMLKEVSTAIKNGVEFNGAAHIEERMNIQIK